MPANLLDRILIAAFMLLVVFTLAACLLLVGGLLYSNGEHVSGCLMVAMCAVVFVYGSAAALAQIKE